MITLGLVPMTFVVTGGESAAVKTALASMRRRQRGLSWVYGSI